MHLYLRRLLSWPSAFAVLFFLIPLLLFYLNPSSFWAGIDYEPLGLADALNMAYRIADLRMYPARGMWGHPGVPFYFMSWLALALAGHPVASTDPAFFNTVIEHVEGYHQITIWLGALTGAVGVYVFARVARNLVPPGVIAIGLLIWLASTPATLYSFTSPSIDSFAIVVNSLFFVVLVRLAYDRDLAPSVAGLAGCVAALAYLNKLSYVYIPVALVAAGISILALRKAGWVRGSQLCIVYASTFLLLVFGVGMFIIGREGFLSLLKFHWSVILGSGLYGAGDQVVVNRDQIWRAVAALPVDRAYAIFIALIGGPCLAIGGFASGRRGLEHVPVAVISIGTGIASFLSAIFVIKHYDFHYTAGVSATLPPCAVAGYLLARSFGYTLRTVGTALAAIAILFMANQTRDRLLPALAARTNISRLAEADLQEIRALAGSKGAVEFAYRAPFSWYGEGFIITFASIPRLTDGYVRSRREMFSSMTAGLIDREVGVYVLDKAYFPTVESIKAAPNVALLGPKPVAFKDGDKLIELHTVFLLIPG